MQFISCRASLLLIAAFTCTALWGCGSSGTQSGQNDTMPEDSDRNRDTGKNDTDTANEPFNEDTQQQNISSSDSGDAVAILREPEPNPPDGLSPERVPMFVVIGNDDNGYSGLDDNLEPESGAGGTAWLVDFLKGKNNPQGTGNVATFDGLPVHFSLYGISDYLVWEKRKECKYAWRMAMDAGHEIANHTATHPRGRDASYDDWTREITTCQQQLTKPYDESNLTDMETGLGIGLEDVIGFRAPYLEYNDAMLTVLEENNFAYDCSIEEGYQNDQSGTGFLWPYTLHNGSPADASITSHPSLWEIPVYPFIVPSDSQCSLYDIDYSLRSSLQQRESGSRFRADHDNDYINMTNGKIRGLDYDLWAEYQTTASEFLAILKHTLDKRLEGNRAPLTVCMHTDFYTENPWGNTSYGVASHTERQKAIEDFITYALGQPDVRVVSARELLQWLRSPVPL